MPEGGFERRIAGSPSDALGALPMAVVAYDARSTSCRAVAERLRGMLDDHDRRLAPALGLDALEHGPASLPAWFSTVASIDEGARWGILAPAWRAWPVQAGIQGVVVLEAADVLAPGAAPLAASWLAASGRLRALLVVLLDRTAAFAGYATTTAEVRTWLQRLGAPETRPLRAVLASGATDDGLPLDAASLADGVAAALATDLVLADRTDLRPLSAGLFEGPGVTLAALGARGLRYSPARLASPHGSRLVRDLLEGGPFAAPKTAPEASSEPADCVAALSALWPRGGAGQPQLLLSESRTKSPGPPPALTLPTRRAGMDLGTLLEGVALDSTPKRDWVGAIHDLDYLVRRGRLPRWLNQVDRRLDEQKERARERLHDLVARSMASTGGVRSTPELLDRVEERARFEYGVVLEEREATSLERDLTRIEDALEAIPHLLSLSLRTAALLLVQGLMLFLAIRASDGQPALSWWPPLALLAGTAAAAVGLYLNGQWRAQRARDAALAHVAARARADALLRLEASLHALRDHVLVGVAASRVAVDQIQRALDPQSLAPPTPPGDGSKTVRLLPLERDLPAHYGHLLTADLERPERLRLPFERRLTVAVHRVLRGGWGAADAAAWARRYAERQMEVRIRTGDALWRHLVPPGAAAPGGEPWHGALEHLAPSEGRVFGRGEALTHALWAGGRCHHVGIVPWALTALAFPRADQVRRGVDEHLVACVSVVELGAAAIGGGTA